MTLPYQSRNSSGFSLLMELMIVGYVEKMLELLDCRFFAPTDYRQTDVASASQMPFWLLHKYAPFSKEQDIYIPSIILQRICKGNSSMGVIGS